MAYLLIVSVISMLAIHPVYSHTGDTYFAQRDTVVVDGDLTDWPENAFTRAAYYSKDLADPDDEADFQASYAVSWMGDRLFLAAIVTDDVHRNPMGSHREEGDHVRFLFLTDHVRNAWTPMKGPSVTLALSSLDGSVTGDIIDPGAPEDTLAYAIIRDAARGVTLYEAEITFSPEALHLGDVLGFRFGAWDNDGFLDGMYRSSPAALTMPRDGVGDLVLADEPERRRTLSGTVSGMKGVETTFVHAFDGDRIVGSDICQADGSWSFEILIDDAEVAASQGNLRSSRVKILGRPPGPLSLSLSHVRGSISGRVTKENGIVPIPLVSVGAYQGHQIRGQTLTDFEGHYLLSGLDTGTYEIWTSVTNSDSFRLGDMSRSVVVVEGETTAVKDLHGAETFDRPEWSDDVFEAIASVYEYDRQQPFAAEIIETLQIENYAREKIMLSSARGERFPAYLALPQGLGEGPFPCLITLHAGGPMGKDRSDLELIRRRMTDVGYAVAAIDAKLFNERAVEDGSGWTKRHAYIQTVIDYRRLIDYLSSRAEIDSTRIGIYGGSMGVKHGLYLAGVEDRIKAFVMRGPGLQPDRLTTPSDISDRLHYATKMPPGIPKILFAGYYDWSDFVQGTLRLMDLLDDPAELVWYPTSHTIPPALYIDQMVEWLMENL